MSEVVVRRDSMLAFLRDRAADRPTRPGPPAGLCVLSGGIVARNLTERMAAESLPADLVETTTVEDLAADLVAADRGVPATVLDRPVRKRAIEAVLAGATDRDTPLGRFARRVPFDGPDVLDAVAAELNEYHRCTDAAADRDHEALAAVVDEVAPDSPFAAEATRESVRAFRALDGHLRDLIGDGPTGGVDGRGERSTGGVGGSPPETEGVREGVTPFVSRSHLVRAARTGLPGAWSEATGDPDWVAVATVSALDNPTLRLLLSIAGTGTTVHLFAGAGTADYFRRRIGAAADATGAGIDVRGPEGDPSPASDGAGALLAAASEYESVRSPPGVRTVAAPDRRREVEYAVRAARRTDGSTLLVARDAAEYGTPLRDVALTADRPFRVETRREVRSLPPYRAVAAALELLAAAEADAVSPRDLVEPLRRGFVLPSGNGESNDGECGGDRRNDGNRSGARDGWPLPASAVREIRDLVGRGTDPEKPLSAWRETVASAAVGNLPRDGGDVPGDGDDVSGDGPPGNGGTDPGPYARTLAFVEWVDRHRGSPPADGTALGTTLDRLLDAAVVAAREREVRRIDGIAVETGRALAAEKHPVYGAERVQGAVPGAVDAYGVLCGALDRPAAWETALAAFRHGTGAESYGLPNDDADAVEVIDAGNAHFRRADRVFVLGLAAGQFPGRPRSPAFVRRAVREAVARRPTERPFLYLDGEAVGYGRDLDAYEAALRAAREGVTLVRPYKDLEGRDVAHSPFLDAVEFEAADRRRIDLGDWVGVGAGPPGSGKKTDWESWDDLWDALPPKERLRALARYADRPAGRGPGPEELERLAARIDDHEVRRRVRRRIARFRELTSEGDDD